jgi:hypothetical protein
MWNSGSEAGHRVRAVGLHDQLRPAGRARRRDQRDQVVGRWVHRHRSTAGTIDCPPVAEQIVHVDQPELRPFDR